MSLSWTLDDLAGAPGVDMPSSPEASRSSIVTGKSRSDGGGGKLVALV